MSEIIANSLSCLSCNTLLHADNVSPTDYYLVTKNLGSQYVSKSITWQNISANLFSPRHYRLSVNLNNISAIDRISLKKDNSISSTITRTKISSILNPLIMLQNVSYFISTYIINNENYIYNGNIPTLTSSIDTDSDLSAAVNVEYLNNVYKNYIVDFNNINIDGKYLSSKNYSIFYKNLDNNCSFTIDGYTLQLLELKSNGNTLNGMVNFPFIAFIPNPINSIDLNNNGFKCCI